MNKEGAIGLGISWFVAMFVIVILLVVLVSSSFVLSKVKKITSGGNDISFAENNPGVKLSEILESRVEVDSELISVEDLILDWYFSEGNTKENLEKKIKEALTNFEFEYVDSKTDNLRRRGFALKVYEKDETKSSDIFSKNFDVGYGIKDTSGRSVYLFKTIIPISPTERINIALLGSEEAVKNEK